MGFPGDSAGKASACNEEDLGSIPGLGRFPGEGKGLENSMDYSAWGCKETRLSDFHFYIYIYIYVK